MSERIYPNITPLSISLDSLQSSYTVHDRETHLLVVLFLLLRQKEKVGRLVAQADLGDVCTLYNCGKMSCSSLETVPILEPKISFVSLESNMISIALSVAFFPNRRNTPPVCIIRIRSSSMYSPTDLKSFLTSCIFSV